MQASDLVWLWLFRYLLARLQSVHFIGSSSAGVNVSTHRAIWHRLASSSTTACFSKSYSWCMNDIIFDHTESGTYVIVSRWCFCFSYNIRNKTHLYDIMPGKKCNYIVCKNCTKMVHVKCVPMHIKTNCQLHKVKEYYARTVVTCPLCLTRMKYSSFFSHYSNRHCHVIQRAQGIRYSHLVR